MVAYFTTNRLKMKRKDVLLIISKQIIILSIVLFSLKKCKFHKLNWLRFCYKSFYYFNKFKAQNGREQTHSRLLGLPRHGSRD